MRRLMSLTICREEVIYMKAKFSETELENAELMKVNVARAVEIEQLEARIVALNEVCNSYLLEMFHLKQLLFLEMKNQVEEEKMIYVDNYNEANGEPSKFASKQHA
jgi:predicted nuclease with TOPRIM domain